MLEVYAEKEIFEEIILLHEDYPNWCEIFSSHADICLNISDDELKLEEIEGTAIFEFIKANGGRSPIALKAYFDAIYEENELIADKPRSVFFLKYSKEKCKQLQEKYGILVQSADIEDDALVYGFFKELSKGEIYENGKNIGWRELLNLDFPPSNAVVITDNFLFKNREKVFGKDEFVGFHNSINLLDVILPNSVNIEYHVTIITEHHDQNKEWQCRIVGKLVAEIKNLRTYPINVEIVFQSSELYHKRRLILNYVNASCDKGFSVFRVKCSKTVRSENDIRFNSVFYGLGNTYGDSEFDSATKGLKNIKRETDSLAKDLLRGATVDSSAIMGGCKNDKTLKNRLLNNI